MAAALRTWHLAILARAKDPDNGAGARAAEKTVKSPRIHGAEH